MTLTPTRTPSATSSPSTRPSATASPTLKATATPTPEPTTTPTFDIRYLALGDLITTGYGNSVPCPDYGGSGIYNDYVPCNYAADTTIAEGWNSLRTAENCVIGYPRYCDGYAGATLVEAAKLSAAGILARAYPSGCDKVSIFYGTFDIRAISTGLETFLPLDGSPPTPATDATDFASALYATIVNVRSAQGCGPKADIFLFTLPLKSHEPDGCYGKSPGLQPSITVDGVKYDFTHLVGCALSDEMTLALNAIVRYTVEVHPPAVCATACRLHVVDLAADPWLNDPAHANLWNRGILPTRLGQLRIAGDFERALHLADHEPPANRL